VTDGIKNENTEKLMVSEARKISEI